MQSYHSFLFNNSILFKYNNRPCRSVYFNLTKEYGNAVARNLFKRRARAIVASLSSLKNLQNCVVFIKPLKTHISYNELRRAFCAFGNVVNK